MGEPISQEKSKQAWLAGGEPAGNIYSIPPSLPFLQTFAQALVAGELVEGFNPKDDPFCLADATIYLPTRRAVRGLNLELLKAIKSQCGGNATLMPRIYTIGDLDEDEMILGLESDAPLDANNKTSSDERRIILARLVRAWSAALKPESKALFEEEEIVLPSSAADAIRLASSVASFMDRIETEEIHWQQIQELKPDTEAQWWQITIAFLKIVMEQWPAFLKAQHKINPAEFRSKLMNARIEQLSAAAHKGPVIIAGSTGSIPATTRLITAIAKLKNGVVILPGVDHDLPPDIEMHLAESAELTQDSALSTHPQFGLGRLAGKLKISFANIEMLGDLNDDLALREKVLNLALLPPKDSADWLQYRETLNEEKLTQAVGDITLIEAAGERQEALAIALAMRQALETDGQTASLITPDRNLARRVGAELKRYNINVDDSGGAPLMVSSPAIFFRQFINCAFNDPNPVTYASFLKNEHLLLGRGKNTARKYCELLELLIIREAGVLPKFGQFKQATQTAFETLAQTKHAPKVLKNLSQDEIDALLAFVIDLDAILAPLNSLANTDTKLVLHDVLTAAKIACLEVSLAQVPDQDAQSQLFQSSAGEVLEHFLDEHIHLDTSGFEIKPYDVAPVIDALLSEKRITDANNSHPRLHIYGPLEARLQTSDITILGGLNEGVWPQLSSNDPFLNRPMSSELGLPLPERRIGLSAHDFQQLSGNRKLYYTRSQRVDSAPSIASRWLQRLTIFLGKSQTAAIKNRGAEILEWVKLIDQPEGPLTSLEAPNPKPPLEARPKSLSITEIETWIRDPYAIYAKHVLKLRALPDLVRNTDAAMKGNLYHEIVERFIKEWPNPITPDAYKKLDTIADEAFDALQLPDEIKSVWRPRFIPIGHAFLDWEKERHHTIKYSAIEIDALAKIEGLDFTIRGRADRIDVLENGNISVIDYKTGISPTGEQARTLSPQLALEGALAVKGHFEGIKAAPIEDLLYVRLRENAFKADDITTSKIQADEVIVNAWEDLKEHVKAYQISDQGYVSRYAPASQTQSFSKYDHLARFFEWSIAGDDDEANDL